MIENQVKRATCSIRCGEDIGTGWLVTPSLVITAYHCIVDSVENKAPIVLKFEIDENVTERHATLQAEDESHDICILRLEHDVEVAPIVLSQTLPAEGGAFFAYGYPVTKLSVGHRVKGEVSQVLERLKLKMDLDLHVDPPSVLTDFKGISGAALICGNRCLGLLRLAVDKSLGAISIAKVADFLRDNAVPIDDVTNNPPEEKSLVPRTAFAQDFETLVDNVGNGYVFIGGAQGIGKSTFCRTYNPTNERLAYFANYSFTSDDGNANAMHLALPEVFYDWLNSQVSSHLTGKAARVSRKNYREIIEEITVLLDTLGKHYHAEGKTAVIFIDGLDEVASVGDDILKKFIGALPTRLPEGLVLVLSAPSYERLEQTLSSRVGRSSCIIMPELEHCVVRSYCYSQLREDYCNTEIVGIICERAQGHPLYLHYLIDLANSGIGYDELVELPLINGSIRNYYDVLWSQLQIDAVAVELLAIIARLRWGLQLPIFSDVLTDSEKVGFSSALHRIRHLLRPNEAAIYHSSFSDYVTEKTELRDKDIHNRLSQHCIAQQTTRYGLLNFVYHCLRAGNELQEDYAITSCNQGWVDKCVTDGVEPDTLLSDVGEALAQAVNKGKLVEVTRLLLLCQRLQFRYNTLFALSAELTAGALFSLGKTKEALQHVVRYGQLIIGPHESTWLAIRLVEAGEHDEALGILEKTEVTNDKIFEASEKSFEQYLNWYNSQVQIQTLKKIAGDTEASDILQNTLYLSMKLASENIEDEEARQTALLDLSSIMLTCSLCFENRYTPVSVIREKLPLECSMLLETLLRVIVNYRFYCEIYGVTLDKEQLQVVFSDIQGLLDESGINLDGFTVEAVDCVISLGAPFSIVNSISAGLSDQELPKTLSVLNDNELSIDEQQLHQNIATLRVKAFLDANLPCKSLPEHSQLSWQKKYETLIHTLAWSEGAARRAKDCDDNEKLSVIWKVLENQFFKSLVFVLSERADWKESYAIPEELTPLIYSILTDFLIDVYPERLGFLLSFIDEHFSNQCGVYSEGFRRVLAGVLTRITKVSLSEDIEDQAFSLLQRWTDFCQRNVKNRHELVPELLSIIPLFVNVNAPELASDVYQAVLANSMGPNWYKEDQLSLLVDALTTLPSIESSAPGLLSSVAGILEAASGEMTFQRYVRFDKAGLIEALCKHNDFENAVKYFKRQVCGTGEQLFSDVKEDDIDRVSPLRGPRFPGGALDEQDAIVRLVDAAVPHTDWRLCWSLLEIYQFGDSRYLDRFATLYARLVAQTNNIEAHREMAERLTWICESELEQNNKSDFLKAFLDSFSDGPPEPFKVFLQYLPEQPVSNNYGAQSSVTCSDIPQSQDTDSHESYRDKLVMPGLIGTQSSNVDCEDSVQKANKLFARGNRVAAQSEALQALRSLQNGGWSILGKHSDKAERAKEIIYHTSSTVGEFIKSYAPLILSEKHVELWRGVSHLIGFLGNRITPEERGQVLQCVIEHCELMVGDVTEQAAKFEFLENSRDEDINSTLFNLLAYLVEHPNWNVRNKAGEMIFWLCHKDASYISKLIPKAFSMSSDNAPDLFCGMLEMLSKSNLSKVWEELTAGSRLKESVVNCRHVGRVSTILAVAQRAASEGKEGAEEICRIVRGLVPQVSNLVQDGAENNVKCPEWCLVAKYQWQELCQLGMATSALAEVAKAILQQECAPLTIEEAYEIELLLANRFGGNANHPQGRWAAKVCYSLMVAIFENSSEDLLPLLGRVFRRFNPSRLDKHRTSGFALPTKNWYRALKDGRSFKPIHKGQLYLDYLDRVWIEEESCWRFFRLTAFMFERGKSPSPPQIISTFRSTEEPKLCASWPETCVRVEPWPAFLGAFTPAFPSEVFTKFTRLQPSHFMRSYWKRGRTPEWSRGDYEHEGCSLSVSVNSLRLPTLVNLAWLCEIDDVVTCLIYNGD